jgi:hypothetical protein
MYFVASKSLTSQAKRTGKSAASNCSMGAAPLRPARRASQVLSTSVPMEVTSPVPVMTTRRPLAPVPSLAAGDTGQAPSF